MLTRGKPLLEGKPNVNYGEHMKCSRSECYDPTLNLSVNGQKVKEVTKQYTEAMKKLNKRLILFK